MRKMPKKTTMKITAFVYRTKPDRFYNQNELKKGKEIELEHTPNKKLAKMIAKHHLEEFSDYYTRLIQMEKEAR
jgi:hypothetical protein